MGCSELSIGDTTGVGVPDQVEEMVSLLGAAIPLEKIALHLHDTRGTALANVMAAMNLGVGIFDSSAAGLGGCPYAPGAPGNLATEDLLYMLHGMGIETGIDLDKVVEASAFVSKALGFVPPGRYYRAAISKDRRIREEEGS
jgi:hydroxymethylglutaryl-CoA lyase